MGLETLSVDEIGDLCEEYDDPAKAVAALLDEIKARKTPGQDNTTVIIYRHIGTSAMSSPEPIGKQPLEAAPHQAEPNADAQTGERAKQTTAASPVRGLWPGHGSAESAWWRPARVDGGWSRELVLEQNQSRVLGVFAHELKSPVFSPVTINPKLGTRIMKKASLLFIAWLFAANLVFAEAPAITGIVAVVTTAD